ncbi:MAG: hypothetical protein ACI8S6_003161 [Myxococcota bacterium]|jgi:hypothetical protein
MMEERITALESRLGKIEARLEQMTGLLEQIVAQPPTQLQDPAVIAALGRIAAAAPELEYVASALAAAPELLGEVADTLRGFQETETDFDARLRGGLALLTSLSTPDTLQTLVTLSEPDTVATIGRLVEHAAALEPLLAGLTEQPRALSLLAELGCALDAATAQPIGPWGLLTVSRDDEVKRTLGLVLSVVRHLGRAQTTS